MSHQLPWDRGAKGFKMFTCFSFYLVLIFISILVLIFRFLDHFFTCSLLEMLVLVLFVLFSILGSFVITVACQGHYNQEIHYKIPKNNYNFFLNVMTWAFN